MIDMKTLRVATYNIHKGVQGVGPRRRLEIHNLGLAVEQLDAEHLTTGRDPGCPGPTVSSEAQVLAASLDGRAAALVVHRPRQGTRLVEAWDCRGAQLLAQARVRTG